uniref:DNA-directed RNA polymerase III subunit RPC5 C-terminal domain-containing protein n=1 Tax=Sinocyclocheilus grahami TaxID=75366 RepID=A0A672K6G7_SINGR
MQRELDARRLKAARNTASSGESAAPVQVKQEPMSDSEEPMDTSGPLTNGSINGYPNSTSPASDPHNGHAHAFTPELQDFVRSTFRKHYVLCLSEVKRLFNLHLASLPTGHSVYGHVTDRMLQETILQSQCRQILVPVSTVIFMKNYRVRRNMIQTRLTQELGDAVTKTDVDRLLKVPLQYFILELSCYKKTFEL